MNKKFTILLILLLLLAVGYIMYVQEKQTDNEEASLQEKQTDNEDWDWWEELFAEMEREEEEKLKPICEQEMIPAEYASDCYFRELKDCESTSGKMIPKSELEKCLPVFLREEIEDISY